MSKKYYFVFVDDEASTDNCKGTESSLEKLLHDTFKDNCELKCFTTAKEATDFINDNKDQIICVSYDISIDNNKDFLKDINEHLEKYPYMGFVVLSGKIQKYEEELENIQKNTKYPNFFKIKKSLTDESEKQLKDICQACYLLKEQLKELQEKVNECQSLIFPTFYKHHTIISSNSDSGKRYITNVIKESLYYNNENNSNFFDAEHEHFEIYLPVKNPKFTLLYNDKEVIGEKDPDIRFGLILSEPNNQNDETKHYIYISPTCNIYNIICNKITNIQLLELSTYDKKDSEYICKIPKYNTPNEWWEMNFTNIQSIEIGRFLSDYQKEAILIESVAKDIQQRFSSYYGRQGSIGLKKSKKNK